MMGRNRNRNKGTNSTTEGFSYFTGRGTSSCENETTIMSGARPKVKSSNLMKNTSPKKIGGTFTKFMDDKFNSDINGSIKEYNVLLRDFHKVYKVWIIQRKITIMKLTDLVDEVHKDQLSFNSTNLIFKQVNAESRRMRTADGSNVDFFASLATLVTDALGGVTSIVQACNVDKYTKQFSEIMDNDAEFTKPLYDARSNCFSKYKDVEEIVRRYHSETFGSTLNKISNSLKMEDMWLDIKSARSEDNVTQILSTFDNFFKQISRAEVFGGICNSIATYVDNNPAVLDACESTGKALYGIYDTWGRDPKKNNSLVAKSISMTANQAIIRRQETEISKLRSMVNDEDSSQAKLESTIQDALEGVRVEMKEIEELYKDSLYLMTSNEREHANYYTHYSNDDDDAYCHHNHYKNSYFS